MTLEAQAAGGGLLDLARRCEMATRLDTDIDLAIARLFNATIWKRNDEDTANYEMTYWRYTASIDDALMLVPEGWAVDCLKEGEVGSWYVNIRPRHWVSEWHYSKAATPALALVAAALRAKAQS